MDLSIIIVNWNTRDLLRDSLAALPAACPDLQYEVLVVDNASADGSAAMVAAEFPACQLIAAADNVGFSRGNNLAFAQATGEFVLLLNPDTVCLPGALKTLVDFARGQENLGVVGPLLLQADHTPTISYGFFPHVRFHWLGFLDPQRLLPGQFLQDRIVHIPEPGFPSCEVDYVSGACFLMPRTALDLVGPLDERFFMYFEETDWCLRARNLGLRNWFCSTAEVVHLEGQAAEQASLFSVLQFQKSYRLYVQKNPGRGRVWEFRLAQFFEFGLKAFLRSIAPGDRPKNKRIAQAFWLRAKLQFLAKIEVEPPVTGRQKKDPGP